MFESQIQCILTFILPILLVISIMIECAVMSIVVSLEENQVFYDSGVTIIILTIMYALSVFGTYFAYMKCKRVLCHENYCIKANIVMLLALLALIDSWRWSHLHFNPNATAEIATTVVDNSIWLFVITVCTVHAIKNKLCCPPKIINEPNREDSEL